MAMLAQKTMPSGMGMSPATATTSSTSATATVASRDFAGSAPTRRAPMIPGTTPHGSNTFVSPTESEFSEAFDGPDSVRTWDEKRVGEWLRSIGCGQYEQTFKTNDVTGNNLIECDQAVLKEMGIKKIGDRVRIFVAIKALRNAAVGNQKKRNRDSIMALDSKTIYTPSSTSSPRYLTVNKERGPQSSTANKRNSRQFEVTSLDPFHASAGSLGRPSSPLADASGNSRAYRYGNISPMETSRNLSSQGHSSNPSSANTATGRRPETPATAKAPSGRTNMDSTMGKLPPGASVIRVIYNGGQTKVIDIKGCQEADGITLAVLRKLGLPENHVNNYCFYITDGIDTDGSSCRRLTDAELVQICVDPKGLERGRLILRKLHAGEPNVEEVRKAAGIYVEEMSENYQTAIVNNNTQSRSKIEKLTGESWDAVKNPLSSATFHPPSSDRARAAASSSPANEYGLPQRTSSRRAPKKPLRQFLGGRPPSELISQELSTYFPDHKKDEIERTVSMSQRRSARLSKAADRLSIASNISIASSLKDAPPLPSIADTWLIGGKVGLQKGPRPLSISRFPGHRDSIVSTLQPLPEESPTEAHRTSYVSFDSASDPSNVSVTDPDGQTRQSYYDDSGSSQHGTDSNSLNEQYRQVLAQDGEEPDPELEQFLGDDSWDHVKWMQGSLIGQGSFGSVFLGLLVMTGELMAVKQVEMPSNSNSDIDKRKEVMVAALRREIDLLRDLQHPNIVQYLGANCDEEHFNIFLEYVPGGSIAAMLNNYGHLQEPLIRNFVRQILDGLSYLHGKDIIHRDIKGANVLIDNKGKVKISDFGISKRVEASALLGPAGTKGGAANHLHRPSLQGSVFWMAPEVVKQTSYTRKADVWSLGCLIVEMFTGTHPFPNCSQLQAIFQIGGTGAKPTTPEAASPEAQAFLARTFEHDFERRPSADELLLSPFLKQIA